MFDVDFSSKKIGRALEQMQSLDSEQARDTAALDHHIIQRFYLLSVAFSSEKIGRTLEQMQSLDSEQARDAAALDRHIMQSFYLLFDELVKEKEARVANLQENEGCAIQKKEQCKDNAVVSEKNVTRETQKMVEPKHAKPQVSWLIAQDIEKCWSIFLRNLPEQYQEQAENLTSLVVHRSKTIPSKNFYELMKAVLIMSMVDRIKGHYAYPTSGYMREDRLMGYFQYTEDASSEFITLIVDTSVRQEKFQNIVTENIAKHDHRFQSIIQDFEISVQQKKFKDKYVRQAIIKKFIDVFSKDILSIILDPEVSGAISMIEIPAYTIVQKMLQQYTYYLLCLMQEHEAYKTYYQLIGSTLMNLCDDRVLPFSDLYPQKLIQEYKMYFESEINLLIAPAITQEDKEREFKINKFLCAIRDEIDFPETYPYIFNADYDCSQQYCILDNYSVIPVDASIFSQDNKEILKTFFQSQITFIQQLDRARMSDKQYTIALQRLWDAFYTENACHLNSNKNDALRTAMQPNNEVLQAILKKELAENKKFLSDIENRYDSQEKLKAVIIAFLNPSIFDSNDKDSPEKAERMQKIKRNFNAIYAADPITRIRLLCEWMGVEKINDVWNCKPIYITINQAYDTGNIENKVDQKDVSRTVKEILLPLYPEKITPNLENFINACRRNPDNIFQAADISPLHKFKKAATLNDNQSLNTFANTLLAVEAQHSSHAAKSDETEPMDSFHSDNNAELPGYYNATRIREYLLDQIADLEERGTIGGANSMRTILNRQLPLAEKLQLLGAIGEGKSNNSRFSFSRMSRRSEVAKFYKDIQVFSKITSDKEVLSQFSAFCSTRAVQPTVKEPQHSDTLPASCDSSKDPVTSCHSLRSPENRRRAFSI